jgi:hypothetical protein
VSARLKQPTCRSLHPLRSQPTAAFSSSRVSDEPAGAAAAARFGRPDLAPHQSPARIALRLAADNGTKGQAARGRIARCAWRLVLSTRATRRLFGSVRRISLVAAACATGTPRRSCPIRRLLRACRTACRLRTERPPPTAASREGGQGGSRVARGEAVGGHGGVGGSAQETGRPAVPPPPPPPCVPHTPVQLPSGRSLTAAGTYMRSEHYGLVTARRQTPGTGYPARSSSNYRWVGGASAARAAASPPRSIAP